MEFMQFIPEIWLAFDEGEFEEPTHTAVIEEDGVYGIGFRVSWWNESVGLVHDLHFYTLEDAHESLTRAGYANYTA